MIVDLCLKKTFYIKDHPFILEIAFSSDKEKIVLIGSSGSGKTLLLKMIAGLIMPDSGYIKIKDRVFYDQVNKINQDIGERKVGYVPQDYALFPHLSVKQNILFGLKQGCINPSKNMVIPEVEAWIDRFQLRHIEHSLPKKISGGQQQRVALARALVIKPDILLLDEPFSALDQSLRRKVRNDIKELLDELMIPLIMITHDHEDVNIFAEHVLEIKQGVLINDKKVF